MKIFPGNFWNEAVAIAKGVLAIPVVLLYLAVTVLGLTLYALSNQMALVLKEWFDVEVY